MLYCSSAAFPNECVRPLGFSLLSLTPDCSTSEPSDGCCILNPSLPQAPPTELVKPLTMWVTGPSAGWLWPAKCNTAFCSVLLQFNKMLALVFIPVQVRAMGEAWNDTEKRSSWAERVTEQPPRWQRWGSILRSAAQPTQSALEEGAPRGSAASPCMVQRWHTGTKSLCQSQPYWGEIRSCSDFCMVAQYRRTHDRWFLCHLQICGTKYGTESSWKTQQGRRMKLLPPINFLNFPFLDELQMWHPWSHQKLLLNEWP